MSLLFVFLLGMQKAWWKTGKFVYTVILDWNVSQVFGNRKNKAIENLFCVNCIQVAL